MDTVDAARRHRLVRQGLLAAATVIVLAVSPFVEAQPRGRNSSPRNLTPAGNQVFFSAETTGEGRELWRTDGTAAGTRLVVDLAPGPASSSLGSFVAAGDAVFFLRAAGTATELWKSDGTAAGTTLVFRDPRATLRVLAWVPAGLLFTTGAYEFWIAGPGEQTRSMGRFDRVYGTAHVVGSEALIFLGRSLELGVWRTDGTSGPFLHFPVSTFFAWSFGIGDALYVLADGRLWRVPAEGPPTLLSSFVTGVPTPIGETENGVFFETALDSSTRLLWRSDRTADGTVLLAHSSDAAFAGLAGNTILLASRGALLATEGTGDGTRVVRSSLRVLGPRVRFGPMLLFSASSDGSNAGMLWRSDGTAAGTFEVEDVAIGSELVVWRDTVYFAGDDAAYGSELWRTDGTTAGTRLVANVAIESAIEGRVVDAASGAPLSNVTVELLMVYFGPPRFVASATTDAAGRFSIDGLRAGDYILRTSNARGYLDQTSSLIVVPEETTLIGHDFALSVARRRAAK